MGIFNFFRSDKVDSDDYEISEYEDLFFEFSKVYSFIVYIPLTDEYGNLTGEDEEISGQVEISGDATWSSSDEGFEVSDDTWRDLSGRFDDNIGDLPDSSLLDEFYGDFRNYINSQGIGYEYIRF